MRVHSFSESKKANRPSGKGYWFTSGDPGSGGSLNRSRAIEVNRPYLQSLLLGRARIGVRFHVAPLLVHDPAQLPLHYLERVVYHLRQGLVRSVIDLFFFRD